MLSAPRPLRVLVADDNPVNRKLYSTLLRRAGHEVLTAEDGTAALLAMQQQRLDLVLMDVEMPHLDGVQVTQAYRSQESNEHLPIVALTGHMGQEARLRGCGMDAVLVKPVRAPALQEVLERFSRPSSPPFNRDEAVRRLDGQEVILREIVQVFAEDYPVTLGELREAASRGDADALTFSAHKLAGALGSLSAGPAQDAARKLERMSTIDPQAVGQALKLLELRLAELVSALQRSDLL